MYSIKCEICGTEFEHCQSHTKTCSSSCRKKRAANIYGRDTKLKLPPNTIGSVSEMEAAIYLMKRGYDVFRSLSLTSSCDLVAVKNNKFLRIEVKTGYRNPQTNNVNCPAGDKNKYDVLMVYVLAEDSVILKEGKKLVNEKLRTKK